MLTLLLRLLSALGLLLALTACDTSTAGLKGQDMESVPSLPSPIRAWRDDSKTTRTVLLTIYSDDSATLLIRGPAESVPHWGELRYPEHLGNASVARVGDRTFLMFFPSGYAEGYPEVAEIAERPDEHLVLWFHHEFDPATDLFPQLGKLPTDVPPSATELTRSTF